MTVLLLLIATLCQDPPAAEAPPEDSASSELSRHIEVLHGSDWRAGHAARQAIAHSTARDAEAVALLIGALDLPDWEDRRVIIAALRRVGAAALPALLEATDSAEPAIRHMAVITLGGMPAQRDLIVPRLARLLAQSRDLHLRRLTATALGDLGGNSEPAIDSLVQASDDPDQRVRLAALHALSNVTEPDQGLIEVVRNKLAADDPPTRNAAAQTLRQLAPDLAVDLFGPAYDSTAALLDGLASRDVGRYDWPQWGGAWSRTNTPYGTGLPAQWQWDSAAAKWSRRDRSRTDDEWSATIREPLPLTDAQNIKWIARLGSQTYGNPVVANGKIYVGTNNRTGYVKRFPPDVDLGCLLCFEESTGRFLWQLSRPKLPTGRVHDWPFQGICASPVVDGDRLWIVTNRCELMCLDTEGFADGENDGAFRDEESENQDEADIIWVLDMMKELGVSPHNMSTCSPVLVAGNLFLCTSNGVNENHLTIPMAEAPSFIAVNSRTGKLLWIDNSPGHNILHGQWASPCYGVFGGQPQVIFPGGDGWIYSFDPRGDGQGGSRLLWKFDGNPKSAEWKMGGQGTRNNIIAFPVIYDGLVYVAMGQDPEHMEGDGLLWCIDPLQDMDGGDVSAELVVAEDGTPVPPQRWEYDSPIALTWTRPADGAAGWEEVNVDLDVQIVPNPNSAVVWRYDKFDRNGDGEYAFEEVFHRSLGIPAIKDDILYISDFSGLFHCVNAKTGEVHWTYDLLAQCWGSPVVVDGKVYIGDEDGEVAVFRHSSIPTIAMTDGEPIAVNQLASSIYGTPIVANNVLYIATQNLLYAIECDAE